MVLTVCLSVLLVRVVAGSEPQHCQAVSFMCRPRLVTLNTGRHIARWLDKVKAMPGCFLGGERESVQHEDGTMQVFTLRGGVRSGVAMTFSSSEQQYLLSLTLYRDGQDVGPVWDLTMGRGYNASYHFHPRTATVRFYVKEAYIQQLFINYKVMTSVISFK